VTSPKSSICNQEEPEHCIQPANDTGPKKPPSSGQAAGAVSTPSLIKHASNDIFACRENFFGYLRQNVKSADAMRMLEEGSYSRKFRIDIIHVAVSKMVDVFGTNPHTSVKIKIAQWMGDLTNLPFAVYFDQTTHKGYLNKALENWRLKISQGSKLHKTDKKEKGRAKACEPSQLQDESIRTEDLLARDGCLRNVSSCDICGGNQSVIQLWNCKFLM
jgi:hypothetical protein